MTSGHLTTTTAGRDLGHTSEALLTGHAIAPKLGNATAKYVGHAYIRDFTNITRAKLTRNLQSRTWSRGLESPAYDLRPLPREAYRGGKGSTAVIRTPVPTPVPLVCLTPCGAHKGHAQTDWNCSGECAEHFGQVLAKYPPQVSSRTAAAMWGCYVHNIVNKRLGKPEFSCEDIGDAYDCGVSSIPVRTTYET